MAKPRDPDRDCELHFYVVIRGFGHPTKLRKTVGKTLARLVTLNFRDAEIHIGKPEGAKVKWSIMDHESGRGEA